MRFSCNDIEKFCWVGEGVQSDKKRTNFYYRSFTCGVEEFEIGDFVLIRNDDSVDPEDVSNCFVAQIKDLYDTGDALEPHQAKVQWFSHASELSPKTLMQCDQVFDHEVVEDKRLQWSNVVDADTIFGKCVVKFVPLDFNYDSFEPNSADGRPSFLCRYKLSGNKLNPVMKDDCVIRTPRARSRFSVLEKTSSEKTPAKENNATTPSKSHYCAISTGTPEFPKVLLKRMDDRILESQTGNVRILIAKPDAKTIDDVAETLRNNLVLHSATKTSERPIIHSLGVPSKETSREETSKSCIEVDDICMVYDSASNERVNPSTPKKTRTVNSPVRSELKTRSSSIKTRRNTPRKATVTGNTTPVASPRKRACSAHASMDYELARTPKSSKRLASLKKTSSTTKTRNTPNKPQNRTPVSHPSPQVSSPSKKTRSAKRSIKFADMETTRSGRKVKPVNYFTSEISDEDGRKTLFAKAVESTKLSKFIRSTYSDESGSEFSGAGSSSSDDDMSVSDCSTEEKVHTPSRRKSVKKTPRSSVKKKRELSIPDRKTPLKAAQNVLEESRLRLHVAAVPKSLPCREEEYSDIYSFVKGCLCAHTGGCMYISGVPGTGKTATVHEVVRMLEEERDDGDVPLFNFVEVNGMWMTDPYQCYVNIFKSLTGKTIASQQAANLLEKRFTEPGPKKEAVVLLVDELDRLWTRKQTVMYNIFDWPSKKHSKLIVLAIANTMDLPERLMMNRISSRLGLTRKTFQPYNFKQLQEIIMSRIQELKVFDPDAVQFVARKVAAVSGDARRALDICRHATEVAERAAQSIPKRKGKILVGMEHVDEAIQQMFSSPVIAAIKSSSKMCKLFLQGMLSEFSRTGTEEAVLVKVSSQIASCCNFEGVQPPSSTEIFNICAQLAATHLILVDNFQNDIYMKLRLSVSPDDVSYALTGRG